MALSKTDRGYPRRIKEAVLGWMVCSPSSTQMNLPGYRSFKEQSSSITASGRQSGRVAMEMPQTSGSSRAEHLLQIGERGIGVSVGLEIGDDRGLPADSQAVLVPFWRQQRQSGLELQGDSSASREIRTDRNIPGKEAGAWGYAIFWKYATLREYVTPSYTDCIIPASPGTAEDTAPGVQGAIPVGAGHMGIQGYFVTLVVKGILAVGIQGIVGLAMPGTWGP